MILYSNDCPKCKLLKQKLNEAKFDYEIFDDVEKMIEQGFMTIPILEVDDKKLNFTESITWINERAGK